MVTSLFTFIKVTFDKMPVWVQIPTYILFVMSFLALLFTPRYIDIRLVSNIGGDEFPLKGAVVEIESDQRVLTMITNERGRFSVPISFANPLQNFTFVLYPEPKTNRQKDVDVGGIKAFNYWNKLTYDRSDDQYEFAALPSFSLISTAIAQDGVSVLKSPESIDKAIVGLIAKAKGISIEEIQLESKLKGDLNLTNYDLSYISFVLEKQFDIYVWDSLWEKANTVDDVIVLSKDLLSKDPLSKSLLHQDKPLPK